MPEPQTALPVDLTFEEEGVLEFVRRSDNAGVGLVATCDHLAGPKQLDDYGFKTLAYTERWCAMHNRAWCALQKLTRLGLLDEVREPTRAPRWVAL